MNGGRLRTAFGDEELYAGASRALESVGEPPRGVTPITRGNRKRTAIVRFADHRPVVVQVCAEQTWLRTEAALLRQIRDRTSVPVPRVLASGSHEGVAYMLTAYVAGEDLHERFVGLPAEARRALARTFGDYLAQLHEQFRFDGYGRLAVTERAGERRDRLTARRTEPTAWFREYARRAVGRLPAAFDSVRADCEALVADSAGEPAEGRLYPWDFRPGNALLADGGVAAVLDWEAPLAAGPSLSVAKAEYLVADWYAAEPGPLREAFRAGYEQIRPYPSVPAAHRVAAIADSAVDSNGTVTNPGYPVLGREESITFHRRALEAATQA